ncbi:MAG: TIGR00730 family Rossman fold protein [Pseudomonadota bacterium]
MTRKTTGPSAADDAEAARAGRGTPQTESPTYRLAYDDPEFVLEDELRGVRLMLEYLKPELALREAGIRSTVVVFGSTRIGNQASRATGKTARELREYYAHAQRFGALVSTLAMPNDTPRCVVMTGGGPGIMEAANRGAAEAGRPSIGLNIVLPREQSPNTYASPELTFQFHYFALRKLHFLLRARALVAFPGGFGTLDEVFEALTLLQTGRIAPMPVLLFGERYWRRIVDFDAMVEYGVIAADDRELFQFVDTPEDAVAIIAGHCAGAADR